MAATISGQRTRFCDDERIWLGVKEAVPFYHPDCSVGRALYTAMKLRSTAPALYCDDDGSTVTYAQFLDASVAVARQLRRRHLGQQDVVGLVMGHHVWASYIEVACFFLGIPFHPINPAHEQAVIGHVLAITRPALIFCEGEFHEKVAGACRDVHLEATTLCSISDHRPGTMSIDEFMKGGIAAAAAEEEATPSFELAACAEGAAQLGCILNSSGTTGPPKAVCLSRDILLPQASFFDTGDVLVLFSALDWLTSVVGLINATIAGARRVLTRRPFSPDHLVSLIERYGITGMVLSPSYAACLLQLDGLESHDLSSVRSVFLAGSIVSPTTVKRFYRLFEGEVATPPTYQNCYGTTEFGGLIAINANVEKCHAAGQIVGGVRVQIVDEAGHRLGVGETGEVLAWSGRPWKGYYNNVEDSRRVCDADGWHHTGDLGYVDDDGDLFVVDRKKDVMKFRGVHFTPQEIEEAIATMADVVEVCVFANTDEVWGDRAAAAVVRRPGSRLTAADVVAHAASTFEVEWKRLNGGVFFFDALPKSTNGKILRREIRRIVMDELLQ